MEEPSGESKGDVAVKRCHEMKGTTTNKLSAAGVAYDIVDECEQKILKNSDCFMVIIISVW